MLVLIESIRREKVIEHDEDVMGEKITSSIENDYRTYVIDDLGYKNLVVNPVVIDKYIKEQATDYIKNRTVKGLLVDVLDNANDYLINTVLGYVLE